MYRNRLGACACHVAAVAAAATSADNTHSHTVKHGWRM